jgi:hypothetical protein
MSLDDRDWYRADLARRLRNRRFWRRVARPRQRTLGVVAVLITVAATSIVAFNGRLPLHLASGCDVPPHRIICASPGCISIGGR